MITAGAEKKNGQAARTEVCQGIGVKKDGKGDLIACPARRGQNCLAGGKAAAICGLRISVEAGG